MHKVIHEFKFSFKNLVALTLNEQMPYGRFKKCRIDGKEYEIYREHCCGGTAEKMLDNMLRNFAIQAPGVGSLVGKEVEFVFI